MSLPATLAPVWYQRLAQRVQWAWLAFTSPMTPVVTLESGVQLDLHSRRIIIPGDFHIHAQGRMRLSSDEHVILRSGIEQGGCVFLNTREDRWGNPIVEQPPVDALELEHKHEHQQ